MKTTVSKSDFRDAFQRMGRENHFSYDGLGALYDFVERMDDDCGTETELDVIALCCEFTEYEDIAELQENYTDIETMDELTNQTMVIDIDGTAFIIQDY